MDSDTTPMMPYGAAAAAKSAPAPLPPLTFPQGAGPMLPLPPAGDPMPTPQTSPMAGGPLPAPADPTAPPWKVKQQPDGSSVDYLPGPKGDIVLAVHKPPPLPRAMQPGKPSGQN